MNDPLCIPPTASERQRHALTNSARARGRGRGRDRGWGDDIVLEEAPQILEEDVIDNGLGDDDDVADVDQAEEVLTSPFLGGPLDPSVLKSFKAHIAAGIWDQKLCDSFGAQAHSHTPVDVCIRVSKLIFVAVGFLMSSVAGYWFLGWSDLLVSGLVCSLVGQICWSALWFRLKSWSAECWSASLLNVGLLVQWFSGVCYGWFWCLPAILEYLSGVGFGWFIFGLFLVQSQFMEANWWSALLGCSQIQSVANLICSAGQLLI
ncbi:hypothetical protein LOK49_LG05G02328 [Camellia lanceoleosa]|uniref:Uncharacterized protein n=1 Tax=Camellia lanceoleosa TaxID=1840588 RepID=A0ACC0HRS4_9ERIC|nr:hypothetical protein LOK49_LG05G02328 [Camellia lanceoleosa]